MKINQKLEHVLQRVQKPGRYVGGELNSVVKDPAQVDVRFAFCFPDTYEIGMSHLGIKILYGAARTGTACSTLWWEAVPAPAIPSLWRISLTSFSWATGKRWTSR